MTRFCTNCGTPLDDDKKFCTECGTPADAAPQENTTSTNDNYVVNAEPTANTDSPANTSNSASANNTYSNNNTNNTYGNKAYGNKAYGNNTYNNSFGANTTQYPNNTAPNMNRPNTYLSDPMPVPGSKYEPISTWGYIGIFLLTCIPIIGFVLILIWALGGCRKVNKRNMARASLIMMIIGFIFTLIIGFAIKKFIDNVVETIQEEIGITDSDSGIFGDLFGEDSGLGDLGDLLGALTGGSGGSSGGSTSGNNNSLEDIFDAVGDINEDAEAKNDGWPKSLREYPDGTANATASYRTEISGTTKETMMSWIEDLKKDGFVYTDFYDFGLSEDDMLGVNAWWATDGSIYLSVSYNEGTVIVDHTKELPDMGNLLG